MLHLMTTFRCPSDILITSWLQWPGNQSPGPMCGWVGRISHPDLCTSVFSWSKVPLLSIWSVAVPLCRSLLPCPSRWHGSFHSMVCDGWLVSYTALPCPGGSGLCTSCERVHVFLMFSDPQTELPACVSNIWAGAVLASHYRPCRGREPCHRLGQGKSGRLPKECEVSMKELCNLI